MAARRESDFQRLQALLREAEQRAGQAEQYAVTEQQARQQAERRAVTEQQARQQAELRAGQAEQQANIERRRNRLTTFEEFIENAHNYLFKPLEVQTDKSLSTKSSITSPKNRICPVRLRPWTEFPQTQQRLFDAAYSFFHPPTKRPPRIFSPVIYLEELGRRVCGRKLASEQDLESYERFAVEGHISDILSALSKIPEARQSLFRVDHLYNLSKPAFTSSLVRFVDAKNIFLCFQRLRRVVVDIHRHLTVSEMGEI